MPVAQAPVQSRRSHAIELTDVVAQCTPAEALLEILARPGVARVQVNGHHLALSSVEIPGLSPQRLLVTVHDAARLPTSSMPTHKAAMAALALAGAAIAAAPDPDSAQLAIVVQTAQLLGADDVELWLEAPGGKLVLGAANGSGVHGSADSEHLATQAHRSRSLQQLTVEELEWAAAPVQMGDVNLGALAVCRHRGAAPLAGDVLLGWAAQAAVWLDRARHADTERRHSGELAELAEIAREIAGALEDADDPRQLLGRLTERIARWLDVEMAGLLMLDTSAGRPDRAAAVLRGARYRARELPHPPAARLTGRSRSGGPREHVSQPQRPQRSASRVDRSARPGRDRRRAHHPAGAALSGRPPGRCPPGRQPSRPAALRPPRCRPPGHDRAPGQRHAREHAAGA